MLGEGSARDGERRQNPDGLDLLVILSPFAFWSYYAPPARPDNGRKLAAVIYDTLPFPFPPEHG